MAKNYMHIDELVKIDPDDASLEVRALSDKLLRKLVEETLEFVADDTKTRVLDYSYSNIVLSFAFRRYPSEQLRDTFSELAGRAMLYLSNSALKSRCPDQQTSAIFAAECIFHNRQLTVKPEVIEIARKNFKKLANESTDKYVRQRARGVLEEI